MYMTTEPSRTELTKEQKLAAEQFGKKDIKGFAPWQSKQTNTGAHVKKAASPSSRILPLDGLRALAIIGVIFYHARPSLLSGGFLGVTLFFVLAGYFATRSMVHELKDTGSFDYKRYLVKRLRRLMPPVLVTIALTALAVYIASPSLLPKLQADALPSALFVSNWSYIFRKVSYFDAAGLPSPLTHLWYLGVSMQFFIVWPLVFLGLAKFTHKRKPLMVCVTALTLLSTIAMALQFVPGQDTARVYYGLDTRAAELLVGAALALGFPYVKQLIAGRAHLVRHVNTAAKVTLFALLVGFILATGQDTWLYRGGFLAAALVCGLLICTVQHPDCKVGHVLSSAPLVYLGSRSFSIYLVHYPLLEIMNPATRTQALPWWGWIAQIVIILLAAEVFYRLFEQPFASRKPIAAGARIVCGIAAAMVLALAIVPVNWSDIAQTRAEKLRPELAQTKATPKQKTTSKADAKEADAKQKKEKDKSPKPAAEVVPKNLDPSRWTFDPNTGTCSAKVLYIGDSVTEGAAPALQQYLPNAYVDGKVSRQLFVGQDVYAQDVATGYDPDVVVFALGTNGLIRDTSTVQALVDAVGGKPLYFVTIRCPLELQDPNNQVFRDFAAKNDNVGIIDWYGTSEGHDEYLADDGIHLTSAGRDAYALMVRRALCGQ